MTIFISNLKRIFKSKTNIFFMVILPVVLIIFMISINSGGRRFSLGIVDYDNTSFTEILAKEIGKDSKINYLNQKDIDKSLVNFQNDYIIEIPKGFTKEVINGHDKKIKGYEIDGINASSALKFNIENFISTSKDIGKYVKGNEKLFYNALEKYRDGILDVSLENMDKSPINQNNIEFCVGILIFNMLMLGINMAPIIIKDKISRVYYRIFVSPIKPQNYTLQNLMSFFVVLIIQIIILLTFIVAILNISIPNLKSIFLMFLIFGVFVVAYSLFISNISDNSRTVSIISRGTAIPMAMLGGCFWPVEIMPSVLQQVSKFIPVTWMMEAINKLLYNNSLLSILKEISIIVLFSIVFLLLASWRRKDIVNL